MNIYCIHDNIKIICNFLSLLPVFDKIFEKILFNNLYPYLITNNLISDKQSGFKEGDSTVNQLLYIRHEIFLSFDANPPSEVRAVFLDISKAFDQVWHEGLVFKMKRNGIQGDLLALFSDILDHRYQKTVLNGMISEWAHAVAGVPQGSVLGPLMFLLYINDITADIESNVRIFANDVSLFHIVEDPLACFDEL